MAFEPRSKDTTRALRLLPPSRPPVPVRQPAPEERQTRKPDLWLRDFSKHIRQQKRAAEESAARRLRDLAYIAWQKTHVAEEAAAIDLEYRPERIEAIHAAFDEELETARKQQRRGVKPTDPYVIADQGDDGDWTTRTVEPPDERPYVLADDARGEWFVKTFGPTCNGAGPDCVARFGPHSPTCRSRTLRAKRTAATVVPPGTNGKRTL